MKVIGYTDLPSRLSSQSSQLYATNLFHVLSDLTPKKDGEIFIDMNDDVLRGMSIVKDGTSVYPAPPIEVSVAPSANNIDIDSEIKPDSEVKKKSFPLIFLFFPSYCLSHLVRLLQHHL